MMTALTLLGGLHNPSALYTPNPTPDLLPIHMAENCFGLFVFVLKKEQM